jgi:hypothetical protein
MENRKGTRTHAQKSPALFFPIFCFLSSVFLFSAGCGAPGDPVPPTPLVPVAITDLAAHQAGDGVQLSFTLPSNSVSGDRLPAPPAVEILRAAAKSDGSADAKSFRLVATIPGALVPDFVTQKRMEYIDALSPQDFQTGAPAAFVYRLRTRASRKRASADSNTVLVELVPVPQKIPVVESKVTESAIELSWAAPTATSAGAPLSEAVSYHVYRAEVDPASLKVAEQKHSLSEFKTPLVQLATSNAASYQDTTFEFGKTYLYLIRSAVTANGLAVESDDSQQVLVTPLDTFPPARPQGLVAAVLPGAAPGSLLVDLSWSINLETDLAGYRVYRSEQEGARGQFVTADLLPTPAVRDTSVEPGHRYWYTVTAVDRAGNESSPSTPVVVEVTQPSQ